MTSGRRLCPDCERNAPQSRHAECHVLALLRANDLVSTAQIQAEVFGAHDPFGTRTHGAIRRLRQHGHHVVNYGAGPLGSGWYRLRTAPGLVERRPHSDPAPSPGPNPPETARRPSKEERCPETNQPAPERRAGEPRASVGIGASSADPRALLNDETPDRG